MFQNEIELKRLKSEDFSAYKSMFDLCSSEDILNPADISGYKVDSDADFEQLLSYYNEDGNGIFALRRIVDGEIVGILAEKTRNDEASIGVFVGKPYRNFQYATTSIEEALEAIDASKIKSVSFEVPARDKRAVYLAEHFTEERAIQNGELAIYTVDVAKHKEEYIPRMVGLEIETDFYNKICSIVDGAEKSPERDEAVRNLIINFIADHPNVNGKAIINKVSRVLSASRKDVSKQIAEDDYEK